MDYWFNAKYDCQHVGPADDWLTFIEQWMTYLEKLGRTKETLRTRWYQICKFSRDVAKSPLDVSEDDVLTFLHTYADRPVARHGMLSAIRSFYRWMLQHDFVSQNPAIDIPAPISNVAHGLICSEEGLSNGLKSMDRDTRLAVMLGAYCGLRRGEITRIKVARDLSLDNQGYILHVHGKGRRDRLIPVPNGVANELNQYPHGWLFPGSVDGHCNVDYVGKRIKQSTGFPSHALRRRYATAVYYQSHGNVLMVSRLLGHSNVRTTMRYIGLIQDEMFTVVNEIAHTGLAFNMNRDADISPYIIDNAIIQ